MISVDVLLYDGIEELDLCGPYEVLASCRKVVNGRWSDKPAFRVETVAERHTTVRCANGLSVLPNKPLAKALDADILIVPGGPGARKEHVPVQTLEFIQRSAQTCEVLCAVCTGTFLLGSAGLLDGRRVTTHHAKLEELSKLYPKAIVIHGQRVVVDSKDGNLITSSGISAGIDLALALISRFEGKETATLAAKRIEWPLAPVAV